ncbi:MAG: DUF1289 domain-containing protein [Pseudomonadota bacterium]
MSISISGERDEAASPCIGVCSTGLGDDICRGCGRTFEEISQWQSLTREEKIIINRRIQHEKSTLSKS